MISSAAKPSLQLPRLSVDWIVLMGGVLSLSVAVLATVFGPEQTRTLGALEHDSAPIATVSEG